MIIRVQDTSLLTSPMSRHTLKLQPSPRICPWNCFSIIIVIHAHTTISS